MKRFFLVLFSITLFGFSAQIYSNQIRNDKAKRDFVPGKGTVFMFQQMPDTIKWSPDYKLTISDFKELNYNFKPRRYDTAKFHVLAYSAVQIGFTFRSEKGKLFVDAFGIFIRSKSWIKGPDESPVRHEQAHFDIAEIYARKFEKSVQEINNIENRTFWNSFDKRYKEINESLLKEQDNFDDYAFTSLGRDYYYKKIADELKATE